jgi:hypothetical protein
VSNDTQIDWEKFKEGNWKRSDELTKEELEAQIEEMSKCFGSKAEMVNFLKGLQNKETHEVYSYFKSSGLFDAYKGDAENKIKVRTTKEIISAKIFSIIIGVAFWGFTFYMVLSD